MNLITPRVEAREGINYILTIAIDKYPNNKQEELRNSQNDAKALIDVLTSKYRFERKNINCSLVDEKATRINILETLTEFSHKLSEKDSLIIFYAGHATKNEQKDKGYLIPYDYEEGKLSTSISYEQLRETIKEINKPRHILLLLNCCYAGSFFPKKRNNTNSYLNNRFLRKSRYAFAAGEADQNVSDGKDLSPFTEYIVKFLRENNQDNVGIKKLADNVTERVADNYREQTPEHGVIHYTESDEGGEFSFQLKVNREEVWIKAFKTNTIESLTEAKNRFPNDVENVEKAKIKLNELRKEREEWLKVLSTTIDNLNKVIKNTNSKAKHYQLAKSTLDNFDKEYKALTFRESAQKLFTRIQKQKDLEEKLKLSQKFLNDFKQNEYTEQVKRDYKELTRLQKQKEDWDKCVDEANALYKPSRKLAMYKAFLKDYSVGKFVKKAKDKIEDIQLYIKANDEYEYDKINSLETFKEYYSLHGTNGEFRHKVKRRIDELEGLQNKQNQGKQLEDLKAEKSIQKLYEFTKDNSIDEDIRDEAIDFLVNLKLEISQKLEEAKKEKSIELLYEVFENYKDFEKVEEARLEFNDRINNIYEKTFNDVKNEGSIKPLEDYIEKYSIYEHLEIVKLHDVKEALAGFEIQKQKLDELRLNEDATVTDFQNYISNNPNSIFKKDAEDEIENLKRKTREFELYEKCKRDREFKDLKKFMIEFPNSSYRSELYPLYQELKAEYSFEYIEKLIKEGNRKEARDEVNEFISNNRDHEKYEEVSNYKEQLDIWDDEDVALEEIKNEANREKQKLLCYQFLLNNDYERKNKEVEKILTPSSNNTELKNIAQSYGFNTNPSIKNEKKGFPIEEFRYWATGIIILLITLIMVVVYYSLK